MADIKVGQLWGVDWPDEVFIDPTVRGQRVGYRVIRTTTPGPPLSRSVFVQNVKTGDCHSFFISAKGLPPHWKLIEDVP